MSFKSIQTRITYERDGRIDKLIMRLIGTNKDTGKASEVARRCLHRYDQLLRDTHDPDADLVRIVGDAIAGHDMNLLYQNDYPTMQRLTTIIGELPIPQRERGVLLDRLSRLTFAEFAKLIEAIESYYQS